MVVVVVQYYTIISHTLRILRFFSSGVYGISSAVYAVM